MEFDQILTIFGGTLYTDDFHMDFNQASEAIDDLEKNDAFATSVWVPLLRGLVCAARGDSGSCKKYLESVNITVTDDQSSLLGSRIDYYKLYCLQLSKLSPSFQTRQSQHGHLATLTEARLEIYKRVKLLRTPAQDPERSPVQVSEFFILGVIEILANGVETGRRNHPAYPARLLPRPDKGLRLGRYVNARKDAGLDTLARYLQIVEIESRFGYHNEASSEAKDLVTSLKQEYVDDDIGLGMIAMRQGDAILAPPFTNPVLLNLVVEGAIEGWSIHDWDSETMQYKLQRSSQADLYYEQASDLFQRAQCARGEAAISLRMGCVSLAEAIEARKLLNEPRKVSELNNAYEKLQHAHTRFQGDCNNQLMTTAHMIIISIIRGEHTSAISQSTQMGRVCKDLDNLVTAQFLGSLLLRVARMLQATYSATDDAICCCRCARRCLEEAGDAFFRFHTYLAEINAYIAVGDGPGALTLFDDGTEAKRLAGEVIHNLLKESSGYEHRLLTVMAASLSQTWASFAMSLSSSARIASVLVTQSLSDALVETATAISTGLDTEKTTTPIPSSSKTSLPPLHIKREDLVYAVECDKLYKSFLHAQSEYFRHQENANVEAAEYCLLEFIENCKISDARPQLIHILIVIAYFGLGDTLGAKSWLLGAIRTDLGGTASPSGAFYSSGLFTQGWIPETDFDSEHLCTAIGLVCMAGDWVVGNTILGIVQERHPRLIDIKSIPNDPGRWIYMTQVGSILDHSGRQKEAFAWYLKALEDTERLRSGLSDHSSRVGMRSRSWTRFLYDGLIRLCLDFDTCKSNTNTLNSWELRESSWQNQALAFLEQGLAGALIDFMEADSSYHEGLEALRKADKIKRLNTELKSTSHAIPKTKRQLEQRDRNETRLKKMISSFTSSEEDRMDKVEALIRDTRLKVDTSILFQSLSSEHVALCIWASEEGLVTFAVTRDGIQLIHRNSAIRAKDLTNHVLQYVQCFRRKPSHGDPIPEKAVSKAELNIRSENLSQILIEPIKKVLYGKTHIVFVPFPGLQSFPLSTLWLNGKELVFSHAVSQAPSLQFLARAMQRTLNPTREACFIANSHEGSRRREFNPMSTYCALASAEMWSTTITNGQDLDNKSFADKLRAYDIVHVGTHGTQSEVSPMRSAISFKHDFKVIDLIGLDSKASLVIFAACLSGLGRTTVGNDVLGFSHAVLQSGARAYMGALWSVSDWATMVLMYTFHKQLASIDFDGSIAQAWRRAQVLVHNQTRHETIKTLEEIQGKCKRRPEALSFKDRHIQRLINNLRTEDSEMLLDHPFYWSPFILIGLVN